MQNTNMKETIFFILSVLLISFGGIARSVPAQQHKNPKHPPENHNTSGSHKDKKLKNDQSHDSEIFKIKKVTVRGWNPEWRREIVGEAAILKDTKRSKTETDPAPFPVRGKVEIYIELIELAKAINGTPVLDPGIEIEGHNFRVTLKNYVPLKKQKGVTFKIKRDGLISSRVQTLTGENSEPRLYVPLEDVVKAFGGKLEFYQATGKFRIKVGNCLDCLLEYLPPDDANHVNK